MAYDALVIGGGMAGLAAAWRLGQAGYQTVLIEASDKLGGLASSFKKDGRLYPLGYHHILSTDAHLLSFLAQLDLLPRRVLHWFEMLRVKLGEHLVQEVSLVHLNATITGAVNEHPQEHVVVERFRQLVVLLQLVEEPKIHLFVRERRTAIIDVQVETYDPLVFLLDVQTGIIS